MSPPASNPSDPQTADFRNGDPPGPRQPESDPVEALTARLVEELNDAWQRGERLRVEDILARHPEVGEQTETVVRIVYEEVCLREEAGEQVDVAEIVRRFPHWRDPLETLLDCHGLMRPTPGPVFPEVGETLGGLRLCAELGRGTQGRVFLAIQPSLADRPVVLKLTPRDGREHSSLARLQHTHIVPLYWGEDYPDRNLRLLCMPYLGGATLAQVLDGLRDCPIARRSGQHLLEALDVVQARGPVQLPAQGPTRRLLERASYVEAVCWIGACLADALDYAHQRGLVHLDLKPSNVLLASDGQPLLLDFDLAREPLQAGKPPPDWFGGTPAYMAPEQRLAWEAVQAPRPLTAAVDGRADLYALGRLLHEALGGSPSADEIRNPLDRCNPDVSPGLADIVHKCLATRPGDRYQHARALAADLRRHLADEPLQGVPNRSLRERWRKWRRRRPLAVPLGLLLLVLVGTGLLVWASVLRRTWENLAEARAALQEGERLVEDGEFARALDRLNHGHDRAASAHGGDELAQELAAAVDRARRGQAAEQLHAVVERLGFAVVDESLPEKSARDLEARCRSLWEQRDRLLQRTGPGLGREAERRLEIDLNDLAVVWMVLRVRLADDRDRDRTHRDALTILAEAEDLLGPSPVLEQERLTHAAALKLHEEVRKAEERLARLPARTPWEHQALGRSLLLAGKLDKAAEEFEGVLASSTRQQFWSHFYLGVCCYRLRRYDEAVQEFGACVALKPQSAECYHNRGLAHAALGHTNRALRDFDSALGLPPDLADAAYNRGLLHYQAGRYAKAVTDLERTLKLNPEHASAQKLLEKAEKALRRERK